MTERSWQHIWMDQCEAAESIRLRFGLEASFDYTAGEKMLHFPEAAARSADSDRELLRYVVEDIATLNSALQVEILQMHSPRVRICHQNQFWRYRVPNIDHEQASYEIGKPRASPI